MPFTDPSTVLWENICKLMGYGPDDKGPSIDTVQRRVGVGRGTVQRIKERSAATQIDSLITIAGKLGVPVWKLLQPASEVEPPAAAPCPQVSERAHGVAALFDRLSPRDMLAVEAGRPPNKSSGEAQRMADSECAKHGRIAQMTGRPIYGESNEYVFACVN